MKYILSFTLLLGVLFFSACRHERNPFGAINPAYGKYISAWSSGLVSSSQPIKVRFTEPVASLTEVGQEAEAGLMTISPSVKGKFTWEDERTLIFKPEAPLPHDKGYTGYIRLDKLFNSVPSDLKSFAFDFQTKAQFATVEYDGLFLENMGDANTYGYAGTIYTADVAADAEVEKTIIANYSGGGELKYNWQHSADGLKHVFTVGNIIRGSNAGRFDVKIDGSPLDIKCPDYAHTCDIPAKGDYKVVEILAVKGNTQGFIVCFSDPLFIAQDLNGLITLTGTKAAGMSINGNRVYIVPSQGIEGEVTVTVLPGIKNGDEKPLAAPFEAKFKFEGTKPQVRLVGNGVILPESKGLMFPFEAINLHSVDVEVFKIMEDNVMQFLQVNDLNGNNELERVGKVIYRRKLALKELNPNTDMGKWMRYAIDLSRIVKQDPGAIYQVRIGFRKDYTTYYCEDTKAAAPAQLPDYGEEVGVEDTNQENSTTEKGMETFEKDTDGEVKSFWNEYGYYYYYGGYAEREDPCSASYYNTTRFVRSNVLASNMGIIAKRGDDGSMLIVVANLLTAEPMSGVQVKLYDYQQQLLNVQKTASDGSVTFDKSDKVPFLIVAEQGDQKGYLKIKNGYGLALSRFPVDGDMPHKGIKGYLYGERGVWRPGDSLFLTFILEDKQLNLPKRHPVTLELYDSRYRLFQRLTATDATGNMYSFKTATPSNAPTGDWTATVKVGGATFSENIKIETVKPNRLKVNLNFENPTRLTPKDTALAASLQVNWLHGAPAKNARATVDMTLSPQPTKFDKFPGFVFDDPSRTASASTLSLFDGLTDDNGKAAVKLRLPAGGKFPGMMKASFRMRGFEKGGDFSSNAFSTTFSPFENYVGIHIPSNQSGEKRLDMESITPLEIMVLNADGKPQANKTLSVGLYRVAWRWWWDSNSDNVTNFSSSKHYGALEKSTVTTDGNGKAIWKVKPNKWGRYLVRVIDETSGHSTGDFFVAGYPWSDEDGGSSKKEAASMLAFTVGQEKYKVGENIEINIPAGGVGKALITLETGTKVIHRQWVNAKQGMNKVTIRATGEMSPTVYAHVSLIQPHAQTVNDMPIRQYGVAPVTIEDPATKLEPVLDMPAELKPNENFTVKVSEKNRKDMSYTLAIVDEGLLDLTNFKTPSPWENFYKKEALGVTTWDMYDQVLGAFGGQLEKILTIGGDGANYEASDKKKDEVVRFKPIVKFYGPFKLEKGRTATHQIKLQNYVGSVRAMLVGASESGAYGSAEKAAPVRKDLMVFATLPRILGVGETLKLPISVFTMKDNIKDVNVSVSVSGSLSLPSGGNKSMRFNQKGEQMIDFDLQTGSINGPCKVTVTASGGGEVAVTDIEIEVRNPNPYVEEVVEKVLNPGETWDINYNAPGSQGTNKATLELSSIPPINLGKRLDYLIEYPHGCIEQTTSAAFPQLYVSRLMNLSQDQKAETDKNIKAALNRLKEFQTTYGGFGYWPGDNEASYWGTSYAGHFILEAKALGYVLPAGVLDKWIGYQQSVARNWTSNTAAYENDDLMQSYRLYTLALANAAEQGAMNRLREKKDLKSEARWRLAAAYALTGKNDVARQLINGLGTEPSKAYREFGFTYGSDLRDRAMILETLVLMKDKDRAFPVLQAVSKKLSAQDWLSTQETAYALLAIGKFVGDNKISGKFTYAYSDAGKPEASGSCELPLTQMKLNPESGNRKVRVKNTSGGILYARIVAKGQPAVGAEQAAAKDLQITIAYKTLTGVPLNVDNIEQGTDFYAEVSVKNPGIRGNYEELALQQIFPAGWEIINQRIQNTSSLNILPTDGGPQLVRASEPQYRDIRDDRVFSYFDLPAGQTVVYRVQLNASYLGKYYLSPTVCEAMYDNSVYARNTGKWVNVVQGKVM